MWIGPFGTIQAGSRKKKFLIVAIDYFAKKIEVESLTIITSRKVEKFIWQNIITRFGLPRVLTLDNSTQFDCATLRKYLEDFKISGAYSSICNPQCNGQVEAANKKILNGLQKKLKDAKARWVVEIYDVLWSLRTTVKEATSQTPFKLAYISEAFLLVEIGVQTIRVKHLS